MTTRQTTLGLLIDLVRKPGRPAQCTASYGPLTGHGPTVAAAKQQLAERVDHAIRQAAAEPAFARDDDGALIVVIPDIHGGAATWRVDDRGARSIGYGGGAPDEQVKACHHYTPIHRRP